MPKVERITPAQLRTLLAKPKRRNKYNAKKCSIDGYTLDSLAEGHRYQQLKMLQRAGEIDGKIKVHPKYELELNGVRLGSYEPDFEYVAGGVTVCEDVKGKPTAQLGEFKLKFALAKALYRAIDWRIIPA